MTFTLYTNPMSRGRIARWMCEEIRAAAGVEYETVVLEYGTTMKAPDYLAVNPMGKVPAIKHGGTVVTECAAICAYLADVYPDAGLAPPLSERGDYYRWLFFAAGPLEQAVVNASIGVTDEQAVPTRVGYGSLDDVVAALDGWMSARDYICGDRFTAADVYVGASVAWGLMFKTLPERDSFKAYSARLAERAAAVRANEIDEALMPRDQG